MGEFLGRRVISTSMNLKETEIHYLVGKSLKSAFGLGQNTLFFEIPVAESRADIVYVQTPEKYDTALAPGIHVFEVKMRWDNDKKRFGKQLSDYASSADYVWAVGVNKVLEPANQNVGVIAFSTLSCGVRVMRPAIKNTDTVRVSRRQHVLGDIAERLLRKYRRVSDMARVNPVGERRILIQEKLGVSDGKDG